jgi:hypothetical protein
MPDFFSASTAPAWCVDHHHGDRLLGAVGLLALELHERGHVGEAMSYEPGG